MKTQLLFGIALFSAAAALSQTSRLKPQPSGIVNVNSIADYRYSSHEGIPSSTKPAAEIHASRKTSTSSNSWQKFTSSMNIYGSSISYVKPLQWNDELNAVSFIHRKSATYVSSPLASSNAENGTIVTMISTDCGAHWDSTAMWVNDTYWARYPGGAIYNPSGNTNMANTYMVGSGPVTGSGPVNWIGNWYASKQLGAGNYNNAPSTATNAQQLAVTAGPNLPNLGRHDFAAYGFTATDDGKMRVLAGITDDGLTTPSDTAIMLVTGTFNNGVFNWAGQAFTMPVTKNSGDGSYNFVSRPMMAWNEAGTIGYIVVMGARRGASGSNVGYQPIVYKTINSGQTWALENIGIDFNSPAYADVKRSLNHVSTDSNLVVPNFYWGEGMDCAVDAFNKLHIFSSILGHASNHPDSLNFVSQFTTQKYLWPHTTGFHPYLYDFIYDGTNASPGWSHILVDSMSSEGITAKLGGPGYTDNPWDTDPTKSNDKLKVEARLQMSRTPDGKYLLYTWTESDSAYTDAQKHWNTLPDIKARLMDVQAHSLLHYEINVTSNAIGDVASRAMCHFISPKFKFISRDTTAINIEVPITVSNSNPYAQRNTNEHWYSCANLKFLKAQSADPDNYVGIAQYGANNLSSTIYPNPAQGSLNVMVGLATATSLNIQVMNAIGQNLKNHISQGESGMNTVALSLDGLPAGVYFVKINADKMSSTKKLIIE